MDVEICPKPMPTDFGDFGSLPKTTCHLSRKGGLDAFSGVVTISDYGATRYYRRSMTEKKGEDVWHSVHG
jgi:hypothetical protein